MAPRAISVRRKRTIRHRRAQVRSTDADIDHISDLATLPCVTAFADIRSKRLHPCERVANGGDHILTIDLHRTTVEVPQRRMQHRTSFGLVDLFARKHRIAPCGNACCLQQTDQHVPRISVDVRLRIIEQHIPSLRREIIGATCVQHALDAAVFDRRVVGFQVVKNGHASAQ